MDTSLVRTGKAIRRVETVAVIFVVEFCIAVVLLAALLHFSALQAVAQADDISYFPVSIVPSNNGQSIDVQVRGIDEPHRDLFFSAQIGPGHVKHSHTMPYSDTTESHVTTIFGLPERESITVTLTITTESLPVMVLHIDRIYVQRLDEQTRKHTVYGDNYHVGLTIEEGTFFAESYVALSTNPPYSAPPTMTHAILGPLYDLTGADAMHVTSKPMTLRLFPDNSWLDGHALQTVGISMWRQSEERWIPLPTSLSQHERPQYSTPITIFTPYALMPTQTWRDSLIDLAGLAGRESTTIRHTDDGIMLALTEGATEGGDRKSVV